MYNYDIALIELFTGFEMDYDIGYTANFSWTLITF